MLSKLSIERQWMSDVFVSADYSSGAGAAGLVWELSQHFPGNPWRPGTRGGAAEEEERYVFTWEQAHYVLWALLISLRLRARGSNVEQMQEHVCPLVVHDGIALHIWHPIVF